MIKNSTLSTVLFAFALFLSSIALSAQNVHNQNSGLDYTTIQAAVDAASANDIIMVSAAAYAENVTVNKSLDIRGAQYGVSVTGRTSGSVAESTVSAPAGQTCFKITAANVSIDGFTLNGSAGGRGVEETTPVAGTSVKGNFISGFGGGLGVSISAGSTGFVVSGNDIRNNYAGVYLSSGASSGSVINNVISGHADGSLDQGSAVVFEGGQNNVTVSNNDLRGNGNALYAWTFGPFSGNTIENNNFSANTEFAVQNTSVNNITLGCNWYGSANRNLINAEISGPASYTTFLHNGTDTDLAVGHQPDNSCSANGRWYVNDGSMSGNVFTSAAGNNANPGTAALPLRNVQFANDIAVAGDTIFVDAGTYVEVLTLSKSLQLYGSNYQNPPSGPRNAEAKFWPVVSDPNPLTGSTLVGQSGNISGTTISGFHFDGDNLALTEGIDINGANVDAIGAIGLYDGSGNLTIENNIVKNFSYSGIEISAYPLSLPPSQNNKITNNLIQNVEVSPYGIGILTHYNAYAEVTNNVMTDVRVGFQTGNFTKANGGTPATFSNNNVTSSRRGIFHNVIYNGSSPHTISDNTFTAKGGSTNSWGMSFGHIDGTASAVVQNNTITGHQVGIDFWDNVTPNTITVNGGSVTNCRVGVKASNYDGFSQNAGTASVALSGVTINACDTAVWVKDSPLNTNSSSITLTISDDCTISNSGQTKTGILVSGADAHVVVDDNLASIHGFAVGIDVVAGSAIVTNNHIYDNGVGVRFNTGGNGDVNTNDFSGTPNNGIDIQALASAGAVGATPDNIFAGLTFGVDNQSATSIDASNNYWGNLSGPSGAGYGSGAAVSANVNYCPWLNGLPTAFGGMGTSAISSVHNLTSGFYYCTLQAAIDAASPNNVIEIADVTLTNQPASVNKPLTIQGISGGNTTLYGPGIGNGIAIAANNVIIKDLKVQNYATGIHFGSTQSDIQLLDLEITGNPTYGINVNSAVTDLSIDGLEISGASVGFRVATGASVEGFILTDSEIKNNTQGIAVFANIGGTDVFNNVSISNTNFENNTQKGIYIEKLSNATLDDLLINNCGIDPSYSSNSGLDLNLKYDNFVNITVSNSTVTNSGATGTSSYPGGRPAISMSVRDDGSYAANPATLNGFTFTGNTISVPNHMIAFESVAGPSNAVLSNNNISSLVSGKFAVINTGASNINLTCNWHGTTDNAIIQATLASPGSGDIVLNTYSTDNTYGSCLAPIAITSAIPSPATCASSGQIAVTWTGGVAPYNIAWTGGSQTGVTSPYTITGLAAGVYSITVSDASLSTAITSATILSQPITNTSTSTTYATIQAAIDAASAGNVINVCAGTYKENLFINKGISVIGAGRDVTIVTAAVGTAPTLKIKGNDAPIMVGNVLIDGLSFTDNDTKFHQYIVTTDHIPATSTLTFQNNRITNGDAYGLWGYHDHGTLMFANNIISDVSYGMLLEGWDTAPVTVDNNEFTNLHLFRTNGVPGASAPVGILAMTYSGSGGVDCTNPYVISNNKLYGYAVNGSGILFYGGLLGNVKQYTNVEIATNEIAVGNDGIMLRNYSNTGNDPLGGVVNANVHNNRVDGNNIGLNVLGLNPGTNAHMNSFAGSATYSIQNTGSGPGADVNATCNWYGSTVAATIAAKISGSVTYSPWLLDGSDGPGTGFQPMGACAGSPVVISSAVASPMTCAAPGQIVVTWSGGVGPYDIAWTGGSDMGVTSPYTITGLAAGLVSITVTDASASTATTSATVVSQPVTNTTSNTTYATIQAAIDAAFDLDNITVCAGTYPEHLLINKTLTITGAGSGSNPATNTVIQGSTINVPVISIRKGGLDNVQRSVLKDIYVTTNAVSNISWIGGINIDAAGNNPLGHITLENVTVANCPGTNGGLHFRGISTAGAATDIVSDVKVINSLFTGNHRGISARHVQVHGLEILGGAGRTVISENRNQGMLCDASGITTAGTYQNFTLNKVDFYHNATNGDLDNGNGDLFFLGFNGNLNVDDVVFTMGRTTPAATPYYIGMGINGKYDSGSAPAGNMVFKNLIFNDFPGSVHHPRALMGIWTFSNLNAGVELDNVQFNGTGASQGALSLSGLGGSTPLIIKNSSFAGLSSYVVPPANQITDIRNVGSSANVDATLNNTFSGAANNFAIEDRIIHKIDNSANGLVTWVASNTYVTPASFIAPNTTPQVQRGVDAAVNSWTVNVANGTYIGDVNLNKDVTLNGQNRDLTILKGLYAVAGSTINMGSTSSDGATVQNLTVSRDY